MKRRVVISGMGLQTSLGWNSDQILENLQCGRTRFQYSDSDPTAVVCPIKDFDLKAFTGRCKNRRYLNRGAAFSVGTAMAVVQQSGLSPEQLATAGLFVGTGPNLDMDGELPRNSNGRIEWQRMPALWLLKFIANTPAALISQLAGINGESLSLQTACTAGLAAVGEAFRKIRDGYLDLALAGAGDSRLNSGGIMAYQKAQALFSGNGPADQACRPFDDARSGFVSGEGGAFFLLESLEHARARKANILAEVSGFGASLDAFGMTAPEPEGKWAEAAIRKALADAGLCPEEIRMISSHGTGTSANDTVESKVLHRIFGPAGPPVMALKSWIGHLSAACGAVELALGLTCLGEGFWPHIRNLNHPCHRNINFLTDDLKSPAETLLIQNFGFGGQNCALVVQKRSCHATC